MTAADNPYGPIFWVIAPSLPNIGRLWDPCAVNALVLSNTEAEKHLKSMEMPLRKLGRR